MAKISITWAKWIMIITTLFAPFGVYFFSLRNSFLTVSLHAILWGIMPDQAGSSGSIFLDSFVIIGRGLFYGIFNIWFGLEVIRYFKDCNRKNIALFAGVLSLVYPLVFAVLALPWIGEAESLVYMGPIPIQFVIGILLMRYFGEPELLTPWAEGDKIMEKEP